MREGLVHGTLGAAARGDGATKGYFVLCCNSNVDAGTVVEFGRAV